MVIQIYLKIIEMFLLLVCIKSNYPAKKSISDCDVELENDLEDKEYLKILKFYLNQLNQENFDFVFYIAGVDIHFNDRLGKLKISDEGVKKRDEIVTEIFFLKEYLFVVF